MKKLDKLYITIIAIFSSMPIFYLLEKNTSFTELLETFSIDIFIVIVFIGLLFLNRTGK